MSENKNLSIKEKLKKEDSQQKLIIVSENKFLIKKARQFAEKKRLKLLVFSEEEWVTIEEIDQYIEEEELSKQVVNLPTGYQTISALDMLEAETIKKAIKESNGNMMEAARTLKIARATLYRKIERYGLKLKKQREKQMARQRINLKRVA